MYAFKAEMQSEIQQMEFLLQQIDAIAEPEILGSLKCEWTKKGLIYYLRDHDITKRLGDSNHPIVLRKKRQMYHKQLRKILKKNIKELEKALKSYEEYKPMDIEKKLAPPYRDLPNCCYEDIETKMLRALAETENFRHATWQNSPYYITVDGTRVRSKGEVIIYNLLVFYNIPFAYERPIIVKDLEGFKTTLVPDFTIFLADGSLLYLEHFGMLSDSEYEDRAYEKLRIYYRNNIADCKMKLDTFEN